MARQIIHGQLQYEAGTQSTDGVIKSQLDSGIATAEARSNHTGTQLIATISDATSYIDGRIQLVVGAAPAALDTLVELANALNNDPAFAATLTTALGVVNSRLSALEAGSTAGSFKVTIGDNTASTFTVTHNLGTLDVGVEVYRLSDGQTTFPVVNRTSTNAATVNFGATVPATNSYRVLVSKR